MTELFTLDNLITLGLLTLLQAVLGFDNLLYISLESKRAPVDKQLMVQRMGIGIAVVLRIALLFLLMSVIDYFKEPVLNINFINVFTGHFSIHSMIVLVGGAFILYTATKEILHMMIFEEEDAQDHKPRSTTSIIISIVLMNLVFSFDSILSALALSDVFMVMTVAIVIGGVLMIWLSSRVTQFLKKNRMYEVLGLFILFIVGIMLLSEGGHLAHIYIFDNPITPMTKTTFYFVLVILILTDIVQGRYLKKLQKLKATQQGQK